MTTRARRARLLPLLVVALMTFVGVAVAGAPAQSAELLASGEGVTSPRATFPGLAGHRLTQVSATGSVACGIDDRGWAFCWGSDVPDLIGDGSGFGASSPVAVDRSGVLQGKRLVQISVGGWSVCALDTEGLAYCWGSQDGALGAPSPHPSPTPPVAVATDGVLAGETLTSISVGGSHACALSDSGAAYCWGAWPLGGLADGSDVPVAIDTSGVLAGAKLVDIDAGGLSTCALDDAGDAYCWGRDGSGQLGDGGPIGDTDASDVPVRVKDTGVLAGTSLVQISVGDGAACALDADGLAYCWGNNLDGELGVGGPSSSEPVAVDTSGALQGKTLVSVVAAGFHTCALDTAGRGYCWGYGADGRLGTGDQQTVDVPTAVVTDGALAGRTLTQISPGGSGTCSLAANGRAYCWGLGVLGNGSRGSSSVPVAVQQGPALAGVNAVQLSSRYRQACVLTKAGDVRCWGQGENGALGDGYLRSSSTPVTVRTQKVVGEVASISTGPYNSCLLTNRGSAYCWGDGSFGELGNGDPSWDNALKPVPVDTSGVLAGKKLVALSTGDRASCALDTEGSVYCWGENQGGAMGNGTTSFSSPPVEVDRSGAVRGRAFTDISVGGGWACALDAKGKAYCWGGAVGGADYLPQTTSPTPVGRKGVLADKTLTDISVSGGTACALDSKGKAYCWGYGANGELGDGDGVTSKSPVAVRTRGVLDGVRLVQIRVGYRNVCAVDATSRGYCWGAGAEGQLGNGLAKDSTTPVAVSTAGALRGRALKTLQPASSHTWSLVGSGPIQPGRPGTPVKSGSRTVTWTAPADTGGAKVTRYVVTVAGEATWRSITTNVRLSGLSDGRYDVRVRAVNAAGKGLWSHAATLSLGR